MLSGNIVSCSSHTTMFLCFSLFLYLNIYVQFVISYIHFFNFYMCSYLENCLDNSGFSWNSQQFVILEGMLQIAGKQDVAKRALYEVSTLLHQKARKVKSPLAFPLPVGGQGFHPPGGSRPSMLPPENPMWSHQNSSSHGLPPRPWMEGYGNPHSESVPRGFDGVPPPGPGSEGSAEFSMKILCSAERIGWVIGKGGFNLKQLEHETGATINVPDVSVKSDERVIYVSAIEVCLFCTC